jgi:hypothetical protein
MIKFFRPLLAVVMISPAVWAEDDDGFRPGNVYLEKFLSDQPFNGISPKDAGRFWENWHLVTTRFRRDNEQIRFVYANDAAWAVLKEGGAKFPDGAMFAKVAYFSAPDPVFPSSTVPSELARIQVMKKSTAAYPATAGWGYAVFRGHDPMVSEQVKSTVTACHACHAIVPEKDYVFSWPALTAKPPPGGLDAAYEKKFALTRYASLSAFAKRALSTVSRSPPEDVKLAAMPLFVGSLFESAGSLAQFAGKDGKAHLLIDEPSRHFLAVIPHGANQNCKSLADFSLTVLDKRRPRLKTGKVCDGKLVHVSSEPFQ